METTFTKVVSAAAGWRSVQALLGCDGDVDTVAEDQLLMAKPIAFFGVQRLEDGTERVVAVCPDDWPAVLEVYNEDQLYDGVGGHIDYLGPGEEIAEDHRDLARELIRKYREASR